MLQITIPENHLWDESKEEFIDTKEQTIQLEHSLISISKWESKWHVPFFNNKGMTEEQTLDYIKCMTITQNVKPETYLGLTQDNINKIREYIDDPMTATTIKEPPGSPKSNKIITNEVIYSWMISFGIPPEYRKWHINRLMTLIKVCSAENQPNKKMGRNDTIKQYADLNAQRRKMLNTRG